MIIAMNQWLYIGLQLELPSTDIDLALSTGYITSTPIPKNEQ